MIFFLLLILVNFANSINLNLKQQDAFQTEINQNQTNIIIQNQSPILFSFKSQNIDNDYQKDVSIKKQGIKLQKQIPSFNQQHPRIIEYFGKDTILNMSEYYISFTLSAQLRCNVMIFEKLIFKHNPNLIQFPFRYIRTILKSNSEKLYDWVVESDSVKITDFMFMEIRNDNYFSHRLYVDIVIQKTQSIIIWVLRWFCIIIHGYIVILQKILYLLYIDGPIQTEQTLREFSLEFSYYSMGLLTTTEDKEQGLYMLNKLQYQLYNPTNQRINSTKVQYKFNMQNLVKRNQIKVINEQSYKEIIRIEENGQIQIDAKYDDLLPQHFSTVEIIFPQVFEECKQAQFSQLVQFIFYLIIFLIFVTLTILINIIFFTDIFDEDRLNQRSRRNRHSRNIRQDNL